MLLQIVEALLKHPSIKFKAIDSMATIAGNPVILDELEGVLFLESIGNEPFCISLSKRINAKTLCIPRNFASSSGMEIKENPKWKINPVKTDIQLWKDQMPVIADYISAIHTHSPYGGILKAPTGSGKTVMFIKIMSSFNLRPLIIVPLDHLMKQWKGELLKYTDLKEKDIGIIRGDQCRVKDKKVVIAMIHSLAQKKYPKYIYDNFGIILYDECHVTGAETFSRTAPMFTCKYRMGSSATPRRKDGMAMVFWSHIGGVLAEHKKRDIGLKVIIIPYRGLDTHHRGCVWNGNFQTGRYLNRLAKSNNRNLLLAAITSKLYKRDQDTLMLSDRINILKAVHAGMEGVPDKDKGLFTSKIKDTTKKIVLATYGSAGMGVDIPRLTSLVLATPRTDLEQPIGRLRGLADKQPQVIDVVDIASPIMLNWARKRMSFYNTITKNIVDRTWIL